MQAIARLPIFVLILGAVGAMMWLPAILALGGRDFATARSFFYSGCLVLVMTGLVGLALANRRPARPLRGHLLALISTYALLPVILAIPYEAGLPGFTPLRAYFDMVGSITTTGASAFAPGALSEPLMFWRGLVAWCGGLVIWTAGVSILAPLNLGGEELITRGGLNLNRGAMSERVSTQSPNTLIFRHFRMLSPIYLSLTIILWAALVILGDGATEAGLTAMAVMSTSGIVPTPGTGPTGIGGEVVIMAFLLLAITQKTFRPSFHRNRATALLRDRELRLGLVLVLAVVALFLWSSLFQGGSAESFADVLRATWAVAFTGLSFLATAGITANGWQAAVGMTAADGMGVMILALALAGGGIATTAGGIKLLRVYALYKHGEREFGRLIHPRSVASGGAEGRKLRREGAKVAWVFFMLFTLSLALVTAFLSLTGSDFEQAVILAASALSTTGPLAPVFLDDPAVYVSLAEDDYLVLSAAMILGRMEALALIGLLNRDFWQ